LLRNAFGTSILGNPSAFSPRFLKVFFALNEFSQPLILFASGGCLVLSSFFCVFQLFFFVKRLLFLLPRPPQPRGPLRSVLPSTFSPLFFFWIPTFTPKRSRRSSIRFRSSNINLSTLSGLVLSASLSLPLNQAERNDDFTVWFFKAPQLDQPFRCSFSCFRHRPDSPPPGFGRSVFFPLPSECFSSASPPGLFRPPFTIYRPCMSDWSSPPTDFPSFFAAPFFVFVLFRKCLSDPYDSFSPSFSF